MSFLLGLMLGAVIGAIVMAQVAVGKDRSPDAVRPTRASAPMTPRARAIAFLDAQGLPRTDSNIDALELVIAGAEIAAQARALAIRGGRP